LYNIYGKKPMNQPLIGCCDIGGTKTLVGLVNEQGDLLAFEKYTLGERMKPGDVVADIRQAVERLLNGLNRSSSDLIGFGCSTTGVMNVSTGVVSMNHNMGWHEVPLRDLLSEAFGVPAVIEMDANAAAVGEAWKGQAQQFRSFAFMIVGTGIGSGLVFNGQSWRGAHSVAGEIGHTVIVPGGPLCGCGKHGCLEALASGLSIARKANAQIMLGRKTLLRELEVITAEHVTQAARQGDAVALEIMEDAAYYLGLGVANIITFFDPEAIILGGGVARGASDLLLPRVHQIVQQHLNYWAARETPILITSLGEHAGLIGGARAALDYLALENSRSIA
jgi:glucokinase